jgi:hypothetical protein
VLSEVVDGVHMVGVADSITGRIIESFCDMTRSIRGFFACFVTSSRSRLYWILFTSGELVRLEASQSPHQVGSREGDTTQQRIRYDKEIETIDQAVYI